MSSDLSSGGVTVAVLYILTSSYFPVSDAAAMNLCVALGIAVGLVNGVLIVKARASSMIVTLAMAMILLGIPLPMLVWLAVLTPIALLLRSIAILGGVNFGSGKGGGMLGPARPWPRSC